MPKILDYMIGFINSLQGCEPAADDRELCGNCHTVDRSSGVGYNTSTFEKYGEEEKVGAHRIHLFNQDITKHITCKTCHPPVSERQVPLLHPNDDEHIDVTLPSFDKASGTCKDEKCHGKITKEWKVTYSEPQGSCSACHPIHEDVKIDTCHECHDKTMDANGKLKSVDRHINGKIDVTEDICGACHPKTGPESHVESFTTDCSDCHDKAPTAKDPFIPTHMNGEVSFKKDPCNSCHDLTEGGEPTNGAHQSHLHTTLTNTIKPDSCDVCHTGLPSMDTGFWQFHNGSLGNSVQDDLGFDEATEGCNIYCHGTGLPEGQLKNFFWNAEPSSGDNCGNCHGVPPSSELTVHDPTDTNCSVCHSQSPDDHINGEIDLK